MALPRMKGTRARRGNRRSHHALAHRQLTVCPQCKAHILGHTVCPECGYYRGRQVRTVESVKERKQRKEKEREAKGKGKSAPAKDEKKS